ncbi:MAG: L-threonylcarbamoyladenylate synthase, partial [Acidobacteriota bacterium]
LDWPFMTERIEVGEAPLAPELLRRLGERLAAGAIVVYPTETVYGLGCDPCHQKAVRRLLALKGRSRGHPLLLIVASEAAARARVDLSDEATARLWERLTRRLWPGPLTLVAPARAVLPAPVRSAAGEVGVRLSSRPLARRLAHAVGGAIVATSANRSGDRPPGTVGEILKVLGPGVDLLLDAGQAPGGTPSTVLAITGGRPRLVREGAVPMEILASVIGRAPSR